MIINRITPLLLFTGLVFGQELFDPYEVHTLDIQFYNPNYDQILQDRWEVDDKTYELATIIFNDETMDSVGVRYKGNSTFWFAQFVGSPKFPFNIDFDLIHEDQDLLGYNKVKLSNSIFDATFVRETIGYLTEGYYLPTSEVGYMNVSVNGELLGLYVSVESVNKPFLTKHFGNNEGTFFKCEPQFHFGEPYYAFPDLDWYGDDSTAYAYEMGYELKSESGWSDLMDLIYTLNYEMENIETILNVDRALWYFAASTVMPDLDAYNGLWMHNYYLYRNTSSGQFEVIPWDKDHTFGGAQINTILDMGGDITDIYEWDPFLYENDDERPLFSQLITVPLYKNIYSAHIRTIIEDIYNVDYIQDIAYGIQDIIETDAQNDPNLFPPFTFGDYFQYNVDNYLITPDESHWCGITSTVEGRLPYLLSHNEIAKTAPEIHEVVQENGNPGEEEDVVIQVNVTGATMVELMATANPFPSQFISIPMFDDGEHGDGDTFDNIFGAIIPFQNSGSHVKYYIRASNDDALVLSPQKAEREFYEYTIGIQSLPDSTVVINEINYHSSDAFDPGDWVELYNPTEETLDIGNWLFKDENDDPVFSIAENLSLGPDQYIVLCRDTSSFKALFPDVNNYIGDLDFGLSGGGELIRLFNSEGELADLVEYDDSDPWPEEPDGNGPTLELINPFLDNALAINWATSEGFGSPGSINTIALMSVAVENIAGWNLVGLPADVSDASLSAVYPNGLDGTLYEFSGSYVNVSALVPGNGYWLNFPEAGSTTISGTPLSSVTISLTQGWNLISGISETVDVTSISDPDGIIVPGTVYGFESSYVNSSTLVSGKGYWINASGIGDITISGGGTARSSPGFTDRIKEANRLSFNGSDLYFGVSIPEVELLSYSLPPKPPADAFDVRFNNDQRLVNDFGEVEVMNTTETLIIAYDIQIDAGNHYNWILTSETGEDYILESTGEIVVPSSAIFILKREPALPETFTLYQNYPNPFNPITTIRYDLPEKSYITLTVFDMLGREIIQLVNTTQEAGFKSVQWNVKDSKGRPVSAGVYLYQIQASEFVQTKKMVLLK